MFEVKIENGEKRELIALFHQGPYEHSGKTFEQLLAMATSRKLWPKVANVVGVHYDDPNAVAAEDLRCHAGLQMKEDLPLPDGMELVELKGGKYAILQYKGPYTAIKTAYDYLFGEWLPNSGHDPANEPSFEVYLNNPAETAPEDLLTDIYLPLAA